MSGRKIIFGLILIALGLLLLGRTTGFLYFSVSDLASLMVPVCLIAIGLWLMARGRSREQVAQAEAAASGRPTDQPPQPPPIREDRPRTEQPPAHDSVKVSASPDAGTAGKMRYSKFIGDMFVDCDGIDLQNVEISSFLGDVEIKLHGGRLARGLNRMIISGFIGDVRILVPDGMAVFAQSSNFIGDIEMMGRRSSGFGNSLDAQTRNYSEAETKLYIASNHFIGDVRVYIV
jgi:lia operon protein LiaF